jgi:stage V sporulation protein G
MSASVEAPCRAPAPAGSGVPRAEGGGTNETSVISFAVIGFEWIRCKGRLAGLADVRIEIEGVVLLLQGVRVLREPDGGLACQEPRFRHPDGRWVGALVLPPELSEAIETAVLALARDADRPGH